MNRGEIWIAFVGGKERPVLITSSEAVHDRLSKVTVVPFSTNDRGWPDEIVVDAEHADDLGLRQACVVQCREITALPKATLRYRLGDMSHALPDVCQRTQRFVGCRS
jgi:mRNA-degrading endonuclease toxin of MazEF toxin-antitoxin module